MIPTPKPITDPDELAGKTIVEAVLDPWNSLQIRFTDDSYCRVEFVGSSYDDDLRLELSLEPLSLYEMFELGYITRGAMVAEDRRLKEEKEAQQKADQAAKDAADTVNRRLLYEQLKAEFEGGQA